MSNCHDRRSLSCQIDRLLNIHKSLYIDRHGQRSTVPPGHDARRQTTDRSAVGCRIRRARAAAQPTRADRSESNWGRSARSGGRPQLRKRRATHERPPGEAGSRAWGEAASRAGGEGREGASRAPGLPAAYRTHNKPPPGDRPTDRWYCSTGNTIQNTML